jgi:hypothetical protein
VYDHLRVLASRREKEPSLKQTSRYVCGESEYHFDDCVKVVGLKKKEEIKAHSHLKEVEPHCEIGGEHIRHRERIHKFLHLQIEVRAQCDQVRA